jgi:hypothetical protein
MQRRKVGGGILINEGYLHGAALGCGSECLRFNGILYVSGARAIKAEAPPLLPLPLPARLPPLPRCVIGGGLSQMAWATALLCWWGMSSLCWWGTS